MQRWHNREELLLQAVLLHRDGLSRRAIARALGISRNTVRKLLEGQEQDRQEPHTALPASPKRAPRQRNTDAFRTEVQALIERYSEITAQRVFEILVEKHGYQGGQTAVNKLVRELRPKPKPKASLQTPDWGPGQMAESDWSPYELTLRNGRQLKIQL